jgi:hypothetical protein
MKDNNYRLNEFIELINYFNGSFEFKKPLRFNATPHTPTIKVYKLSIFDNFADYGDFRDGIIQRLKWEKYLNINNNFAGK